MAIKADDECDERGVDKLEPKVALDDVVCTFTQRTWHLDDIFQNHIGQHAHSNPQYPKCQQVHVSLPLPRFESKGFEDRQRHNHKRGADDTSR